MNLLEIIFVNLVLKIIQIQDTCDACDEFKEISRNVFPPSSHFKDAILCFGSAYDKG